MCFLRRVLPWNSFSSLTLSCGLSVINLAFPAQENKRTRGHETSVRYRHAIGLHPPPTAPRSAPRRSCETHTTFSKDGKIRTRGKVAELVCVDATEENVGSLIFQRVSGVKVFSYSGHINWSFLINRIFFKIEIKRLWLKGRLLI